ncbi:MAG TPA: ABC transporter ATP-binding protein [Chromatiaceae bacterium]|nr:ABC transporter ATP-binding protein [Chromatiaceae bacterium]HIA08228.1 ABC transporter ATP-binding protein [Chromatiaceae bacterium]HIN82419.1 ABC transporter ATP-binding protein [Chromatiales bacterium]HIO54180.1 ABC transporter ATP-binding protein [Chromatiales bacterium]
MSLLHVKSIACQYDGNTIVEDLSFHVNEGNIISLLGPSGCGKTTVLRAIAGLEPVTEGSIELLGDIVSKPGHTLAAEKRGIGMVFQDYALFPHLDVGANIAFGLRNESNKSRDAIVGELLEVVGLDGYANRFPHELSGGQQQRVALARALAPKPQLLLMDEPFSSLDVELRERLSVEVRDILRARNITGILVTHDQHEAFAMCGHIGILHQGKIRQWDTPFNLYHEPVDRFVADFIGQGRFLKGTMLTPDTIKTEIGNLSGNRAFAWPEGTEVDVLLRPDDIVEDSQSTLTTTITEKAFKGAETLYTLRLPSGNTLLTLLPSHHDHQIGSTLAIRVAADHMVAFQQR